MFCLHTKPAILSQALCYPVKLFLSFFNNQFVYIKVEGFTHSAALYDHGKPGHNQAHSQAHKGILLMGRVKD